MTRAFPTSFQLRRSRAVDGAAERSRSSSAGFGVCVTKTLPRGLRLRPGKGVSIGGPKPVSSRAVNPRSKLSIDGTEEIEHEREAAQSARSDRVVCCGGYLPRPHIRRRDGAEL